MPAGLVLPVVVVLPVAGVVEVEEEVVVSALVVVPTGPSTASATVTVASLSLLTVKPRSRRAPAARGAAPAGALTVIV